MIEDYPDQVKEIMSHCIIVEAKFNWVNQNFDYIAISDLFHECIEGAPIPKYTWKYNAVTGTIEAN